MKKSIQKLSENQNKIVEKVKAVDLKIEAVIMVNNNLAKENKKLKDRIGGIETILLDMGVNKKALELHQSFDEEKLKGEKTSE